MVSLHLIYNSFYLLFFFLSIFFATFPNFLGQSKIFFIFWLTIIFIFIFFFRVYYIPFLYENYFNTISRSDLGGYYALSRGVSDIGIINTIQFGFSNSHLFYYTKEPVLWFALKYLYIAFNDVRLVFIFLDLLAFLILFFSLKQFELNKRNKLININYIYFLILLHTPIIFGISSIYRQFLSTVFLLASFSLIYNNKIIKSYIFFILSFLSHNASVVFIYLYFIKSDKQINYIVLLIYLIFLSLFFFFVADSRVNINIGNKISYLYSMIFIILYLFINTFNRLGNFKDNSLTNKFLFMSFGFLIIGAVMLSSNLVDRYFLFLITLACPLLAVYFEKYFKNSIFLRYAVILGVISYTLYYKPLFTDNLF